MACKTSTVSDINIETNDTSLGLADINVNRNGDHELCSREMQLGQVEDTHQSHDRASCEHDEQTAIKEESEFSRDVSNNHINIISETPTEKTKVGFARIKQEFLDTGHLPQIATHLPSGASKDLLEPSTKRIKLKGRNKDRPRDARPPSAAKLCASVTTGQTCAFGEQCRYQHDVAAYMASKPADLGDTCYLFQTYGHCRFGVTCRYAHQHITDDFKNITNESQFAQNDQYTAPLNTISPELQKLLWKKRYDFSRANNLLEVKKSELDDATSEEVREAVPIPEETHKAEETPTETCMKTAVCEKLTTQREVKKVDFADKLYLAPLTTVGNLPFRRLCKGLGAEITCGEMALAANLLQGRKSEWALLKRHKSEDIFGVQICGSHPDIMTRCAQLLNENTTIDFIDINCGCPLEAVVKKGDGCALMGRTQRIERDVMTMTSLLDIPLTVKMRTGIYSDHNIAHKLIPKLRDLGVSAVTLHGRSREQRYTRLADWSYIDRCAQLAAPMPVFGNGDILSYEDANRRREETGVAGLMIARGALIKPWIFTEIKEQRHWDISSSERMDLLRDFTNYGLEHWGSDQQGVDTTRRFLLEWLSFLYRYIPVGLLEQPPQRINEKPPYYLGRDDLETMMASANCADWIKISEMLLGPVSDGFTFLPKHKANSYK